jgi:hypothetical protein
MGSQGNIDDCNEQSQTKDYQSSERGIVVFIELTKYIIKNNCL